MNELRCMTVFKYKIFGDFQYKHSIEVQINIKGCLLKMAWTVINLYSNVVYVHNLKNQILHLYTPESTFYLHAESFHNLHFLNLLGFFFFSVIPQVGKLGEVNWLFTAMKGESVEETEIDRKTSSLFVLVHIMRKSFLLINIFNDMVSGTVN